MEHKNKKHHHFVQKKTLRLFFKKTPAFLQKKSALFSKKLRLFFQEKLRLFFKKTPPFFQTCRYSAGEMVKKIAVAKAKTKRSPWQKNRRR